MMSFQHIRYFLALCEEQNFTRAAKRCGITQPSLTNAMKRLEDLLGGPLFHRARKPASITEPTGLALVVKPYFEQAHLAVEAAQHKASKLKVAKHALMVSTQEDGTITQNGKVEGIAVERHELRGQFSDLFTECADQPFFSPLTNVGRT